MPEPNEGFVGCSTCGRIVRTEDVNTRGKCVLCAGGARAAAAATEDAQAEEDPGTVPGVTGPEDHPEP
jgi:hypothetical protein